MSLQGTWIVTQQWDGIPAYRFPATFGADGTIVVEGGYFGTWTQLGSSNQVALAIMNAQEQTITSYAGNVAGSAMGGQMTGGSPSGDTHSGVWSAALEQIARAPIGSLTAPGKSHTSA